MNSCTSEGLLIDPYGGVLVDLMVRSHEEKEDLLQRASRLPSIQISDRSACDLEVLATGGFSPLDKFMGLNDHARVLEEMRLTDGHLFPIPIPLPVDSKDVHLDQDVVLRNSKNEMLAMMTVEEAYEWDIQEVSWKVFGTEDDHHPIVAEMSRWGTVNISGRLMILNLPKHYDFPHLRLSPAECRANLAKFKTKNVVAFQTRNPLHRVHEELTKRAAKSIDGVLHLHPAVGLTKPGDLDHYTRVRTYRVMAERYFRTSKVLLSLLPLGMRMAGPREALWHAIIRRNYGANHLIIGRHHACPGNDLSGRPFYGPNDAQHLVEKYSNELGVNVIPFRELVYLPKEGRYEESTKVPLGTPKMSISGRQVHEYLNAGMSLPDWFTRPEVASILANSYPPRPKQGVCVWFTGLIGSGKSTAAEALTAFLMERGRHVTLLDGDVVRTHLSKGLGFSKEDRDTNILRIGFVASEVVRAGGVVVCAVVSPYATTRDAVRNLIGGDRFVEVYVNTPFELCEERDTKGMYSMARLGKIQNFTGLDDPYEKPVDPAVELETVHHSPEDNAQTVLAELQARGFVS